MQLCRRGFPSILAALLLLTGGPAFPGQRGDRFNLAIAKGSLSSVLKQFSEQTKLQIGTDFAVDEKKIAEIGPFVRNATADEALTELLSSAGLSHAWQDDSTIRVSVTIVRPPDSHGNVREVLVTGTRLGSDENRPTPVRVYGPGKIDRYGVSTVSDLSRYITQQPFSLSSGYLQSSAQFFQMRGLGFDTTLVLINGRRVPPSANSISLNAVDLNNVPMMAVDRIEVMSDAASAIYGADAIGGVVNVIMKDAIEEPEVYLHYGLADGGGMQRRAATSIGAANDRLKSTIVLDYYETAALMGEERELWRNQDYRRFGGADYRVSTSNPGNIYSLTGQPLPGLPASQAAVPFGATASGLTPADFLATAGTTHLKSAFSDWSITPPSRRESAYGSTEYSFGKGLALFGEFLSANSDLTALRGPPSLSRQIVPESNPYNPFAEPVSVDYSFAGMDPISYRYETKLGRAVVGARGRISNWGWEISGLRHYEFGVSTSRGALDYSRVVDAINSSDPRSALNLFSDGPAGSAELLDSLAAPAQRASFSFFSSQLSAFIRGPVFELRGRKAELVVGGEWRHDAAGFFELGQPVDVGRDISSVFSEIRVPLLDELSLKIAARGDDYGDGKQIFNPQYGLTWRPANDWVLRAAYGTSFRPPSLFELNTPTLEPTFLIRDPLRGGQLSYVELALGGNRDLNAVTARSFTAGFVFTPEPMPGLRLGGSYWRVVMNNRIMAPSYQELLRSDSALSGRVVRDEPREQDVQAGWAGPLRSIDLTPLNYGDLETSGIDLDASLLVAHPWGGLQLDLDVTWVREYLSRDMNPVLPVDRVGIANMQGTIPRWRAIGTLGWERDGFGISTTTTYVPSYQDSDLTAGPLARRIGSHTLVDLQIRVGLNLDGNALLDGGTLTFGARNVFDQAPRFANAGAYVGYDISQSELTGRFVYFRLSKRF